MTPAAEGDVVEPLDLPVVRDLVVDLVPRLERVAALLPGGDGALPDAATVGRLKEALPLHRVRLLHLGLPGRRGH